MTEDEWLEYLQERAAEINNRFGTRITVLASKSYRNGVYQPGHFQINGVASFEYQGASDYLLGIKHGLEIAYRQTPIYATVLEN